MFTVEWRIFHNCKNAFLNHFVIDLEKNKTKAMFKVINESRILNLGINLKQGFI